MTLNDRSTRDIVILILASVIAFYIVVSIVFIIVFTFIHPDADISKTARSLAGITSTLIGALIGYLAGKNEKDGT